MFGAQDSTKMNMLTKKGVTTQMSQHCLHNMSEDTYIDVVYQRVGTKLCGYPLCDGRLKRFGEFEEKYRKHEDSIRSKFCSAFCYNANVHVETQIEEHYLTHCTITEHLTPFPFFIGATYDGKLHGLYKELHNFNLKDDSDKTNVDVGVGTQKMSLYHRRLREKM